MLQATSIQAHEYVKRDLSERERKVRQVLLERGPSTLFEIAAALGVPDHTISGRITRLADYHEAIEDTGERRRNPHSGRPCIVWRLKYAPPGTQQHLG
jgi:predicted ArsR family transcriptional regulator